VDIADEVLCDFFAELEQLNKFERFDPDISYCVICGKTFHESIECQETSLQDFELNAVDDTKELVDALNQHTTRTFDDKFQAQLFHEKLANSSDDNEYSEPLLSAGFMVHFLIYGSGDSDLSSNSIEYSILLFSLDSVMGDFFQSELERGSILDF
ncbi:6446_t:CDS:2, partial [Ambispora leptoticha]